MYYLRTQAAADAIQFTLDKSAVQQTPAVAEKKAVGTEETIAPPVVTTLVDSQQAIPYDQNRSDMACSLDNPDACEACGS